MNPPQVYTLLWATEIATLVGVERDIKKKNKHWDFFNIFFKTKFWKKLSTLNFDILENSVI